MNNKSEIAFNNHIKRLKKDIAERDPNSEWDKEKKDDLAYIERQRKLIEEGKLEESVYSSMEELEEDLKQLLHEHKEREED